MGMESTAFNINPLGAFDVTFWSRPMNYNGQTHLGIGKKDTYWKCYLANPDAPDADKEEVEISLSESTSDKPR